MLIYAYDTQNDGKELGPGSKERMDAGIKYILKSEWNDWIIILGAGRDPKRPGRPGRPMLQSMMLDYLSEQLKVKDFQFKPYTLDSSEDLQYCYRNNLQKIVITVSYINAWGSFDETTAALDTFFETYKGSVGYYYAVSADFHLPRIKLIWFMLGLPLHKTIGTPWKPLWKEQLLEPVKMAKVVLKGILHHLKGGF